MNEVDTFLKAKPSKHITMKVKTTQTIKPN